MDALQLIFHAAGDAHILRWNADNWMLTLAWFGIIATVIAIRRLNGNENPPSEDDC